MSATAFVTGDLRPAEPASEAVRPARPEVELPEVTTSSVESGPAGRLAAARRRHVGALEELMRARAHVRDLHGELNEAEREERWSRAKVLAGELEAAKDRVTALAESGEVLEAGRDLERTLAEVRGEALERYRLVAARVLETGRAFLEALEAERAFRRGAGNVGLTSADLLPPCHVHAVRSWLAAAGRKAATSFGTSKVP
ncbi:MAG: hypothetical protein HY721_28175 [Planctomycetes bacterium]|nr:hypothetical protein [Planctomycetota bacterium]